MLVSLAVASTALQLKPPAPAAPRRALDVAGELLQRVGGLSIGGALPAAEALKADLLQTLAEYGVPASNVPPATAARVDELCRQLEARNPTARPATAGLSTLEGDWCVRWSDAPPPSNGALGPFMGDARQIVDTGAKTYENRLVLGPLTVSLLADFEARDSGSLRVRFRTISPQLLGVGPTITFPEGTERTWLLTYCDADLRLVRAGVDGGRSTARELGLLAKDAGEAADAYLFVLSRERPPPPLSLQALAAAAVRPSRATLKRELLAACEGLERGARGDAVAKARVVEALERLSERNPTRDPASSPLLRGTWDVVWTTEAELLALTSSKWCTGASQTIGPREGGGGDGGDLELTNSIDFEGGSYLRVGSSCAPEPRGGRVNFAFESCAAKWRGVELPLPPVGAGWFEVLYLDGEVRVARDVRGDLQVCSRRGRGGRG